jgi:hypothetical protein
MRAVNLRPLTWANPFHLIAFATIEMLVFASGKLFDVKRVMLRSPRRNQENDKSRND